MNWIMDGLISSAKSMSRFSVEQCYSLVSLFTYKFLNDFKVLDSWQVSSSPFWQDLGFLDQDDVSPPGKFALPRILWCWQLDSVLFCVGLKLSQHNVMCYLHLNRIARNARNWYIPSKPENRRASSIVSTNKVDTASQSYKMIVVVSIIFTNRIKISRAR